MTASKGRRKSRNYTHPQQPRHAGSGTSLKSNPKDKFINIVSYNIRFAQRVKKAITLFLEHPRLQNADIIFLQEMDPKGVDHFAKILDYNYVYYPAVRHPSNNRDFGNAILSKWPIKDDYKLILPNTPRQKLQRIAVGAKIQIHDKNIYISNVHMKVFLKPDRRSDQIDFVLTSLPSQAKYSIIAGDLNTHSKKGYKAILDSFQKANYEHASKNIGWTHKHWIVLYKKSSLDHIFVKGLEIIEYGKITNRKASDHLPIWAKLAWK